MDGFVHSVETMGTVDGPGLRFVVFLQGCPMRCSYCHNPDTWQTGQGSKMSAEALMSEFSKNRPFYRKGGITVSGGEPLLQIDFLIELFTLAKEENVHTCVDTSGITYNPDSDACNEKLDKLLSLTDLVLLDIKHTDPSVHRELTGCDNKGILAFAKYLDEKKIPVWIRHVVVPGITDGEKHLSELGRIISQLSNVQALDVLPYHNLGAVKYERLGIPYPLEDVPPATSEEAQRAKALIIRSYLKNRQDHR